jgi:formamidopyrimidine-DNA glycosylase
LPELPDITVYIEALGERVLGARLDKIQIVTPFLLRTAVPPLESTFGRSVRSLQRLGKRIVIELDGELYLVLHLMLAGRLHWFPKGAHVSARSVLARFIFDSGTLTLTEAGSKRRASLHVIEGAEALKAHNPGGLEVLDADSQAFAAQLRQGNFTVKRALTDPRLLSGIGNTYSDEIMHLARLSPMARTQSLSDDELQRLFDAAHSVLFEWTQRLRAESHGAFPEKVTSARPGMAVHGRFGQPCPVCGTEVQRIRFTEREANYCPRCQTEGRLLADRSLSRLLKDDWPKTIEELEKGVTRKTRK